MAKKNKNTMTFIIVGLAILVIGYLVFMSKGGGKKTNGNGNGGITAHSNLPAGCYPLEEVHESNPPPGSMWVGIIPEDAQGQLNIRPPAGAYNIGDQFTITHTNSALDGSYTIQAVYTNPDTNQIGGFLTNVPPGYNFNYTATQGGDPRDITYFGIGRICLM